jgi:hypothetical protein
LPLNIDLSGKTIRIKSWLKSLIVYRKYILLLLVILVLLSLGYLSLGYKSINLDELVKSKCETFPIDTNLSDFNPKNIKSKLPPGAMCKSSEVISLEQGEPKSLVISIYKVSDSYYSVSFLDNKYLTYDYLDKKSPDNFNVSISDKFPPLVESKHIDGLIGGPGDITIKTNRVRVPSLTVIKDIGNSCVLLRTFNLPGVMTKVCNVTYPNTLYLEVEETYIYSRDDYVSLSISLFKDGNYKLIAPSKALLNKYLD